jgi:hypothetical protein
MHEKNMQTTLLGQIRKRLPPNVSFVDELGELLSISRDSAYRRIRGETILSLDEVGILYSHFGISVDELLSGASQMVTFHHRIVEHKNYDFKKWLNSIIRNLAYLRTFKSPELIFAAKDIPMFYYFRNPSISAFKQFFWMKTLLGDPDLAEQQFSLDAVPNEQMALAEKAWLEYSALPSTEIWNEQVIYDTLKQIDFYHQCKLFRTVEDAILICNDVIELLQTVRAEASTGKKSEGGALTLYNNDIFIADNTVFAQMDDRRAVYVNQNTFSILLTFQEPFCEQTEGYLRNLLKKSTLISSSSEMERTRFFNKLVDRVEAFKSTLK